MVKNDNSNKYFCIYKRQKCVKDSLNNIIALCIRYYFRERRLCVLRNLDVILHGITEDVLRLRKLFRAGGNEVSLRTFDTTGIDSKDCVLRLRKLEFV